VLLWEVLAGRHPFWGMPLQEVAREIAAGAPPLARERPELPRRLLAAIDRALAPDPELRPRASELASELRRALKSPEQRAERTAPRALAHRSEAPALRLGSRILPSVLGAATAGVGATLLPFWPPVLVAVIVLAAGAAAAFKPRLGLAIALASPIFPLGNEARSAAILYGAFAACWLVASWRDAGKGLLFVSGPLLAPLGALALVPLAVQPARGTLRRAAQGTLAVLSATLIAGLSGNDLPFGGAASASPAIAPTDSVRDGMFAIQDLLAGTPVLVAAALLAGLAAAALPFARARSRWGVAAVGVVVVVCSLAAGAGPGSVPLLIAVWGVASALAAGTGR
jgi:hypothetical protein